MLRANDGKYYYANPITRTTSWFPPDPTAYVRSLIAALPPGWRLFFTTDDATPYYVSAVGARTWRHPAETTVA